MIPSVLGCPQECPLTAAGKVCNDAGICRWDSDLGAPRCFCDSNYISKACDVPAGPMPVGKIVGALFGGIALGAAIVVAYAYSAHYMGGGASSGAATAAGGNEGYYEVDDH